MEYICFFGGVSNCLWLWCREYIYRASYLWCSIEKPVISLLQVLGAFCLLDVFKQSF